MGKTSGEIYNPQLLTALLMAMGTLVIENGGVNRLMLSARAAFKVFMNSPGRRNRA